MDKGRNLITNAGAMHLSKGKWKQLECIDTSIRYLIKVITKWAIAV